MSFKFYNESDLICKNCKHKAIDHMPTKCTKCNKCEFFLDDPQEKLFVIDKGELIEIKHPHSDQICTCGYTMSLIYGKPVEYTIISPFDERKEKMYVVIYRCQSCRRIDFFNISYEYMSYLMSINAEK